MSIVMFYVSFPACSMSAVCVSESIKNWSFNMEFLDHIAQITEFGRLGALAEAVNRNDDAREIVKNHQRNRYELRLWIAVHEDLPEQQFILHSVKYKLKYHYSRWTGWDMLNKYYARLSEVIVGGPQDAARKCCLPQGMPRNTLSLAEAHRLFEDVAVIRGPDNEKTRIVFCKTPNSHQKTTQEIVKNLPINFEEMRLCGIREQLDLIYDIFKHFRHSQSLSRVDTKGCVFDSRTFSAFADLFLEERATDFHAYFGTLIDINMDEEYKFPFNAVVHFVEKYSKSNGKRNGYAKYVEFPIEEKGWDNAQEVFGPLIEENNTRGYLIHHQSKRSSLLLQTAPHYAFMPGTLILKASVVPYYGEVEANNPTNRAVAVLQSDLSVSGTVYFYQEKEGQPTTIKGVIRGLYPGRLHGFHVHQFGDSTNGCMTAGPHFNPFGKTHGGPKDDNRHAGDLGNVEANEHGVATFEIVDSLVQIHGVNSVVGRSLVVHAGEDDLGRGKGDKKEESLKTGNAGTRAAWGIIAIAAST
uniref:superoxide dismutase n=1 Tax=Steinernema glaseri TaxID=37863 RepID=A0A1I7YR07_9BILA